MKGKAALISNKEISSKVLFSLVFPNEKWTLEHTQWFVVWVAKLTQVPDFASSRDAHCSFSHPGAARTHYPALALPACTAVCSLHTFIYILYRHVYIPAWWPMLRNPCQSIPEQIFLAAGACICKELFLSSCSAETMLDMVLWGNSTIRI